MDLMNVPALDTPFKVTQGRDFGANRKRVYDFLLVHNSNLGHMVISCTVSDVLRVFCTPE